MNLNKNSTNEQNSRVYALFYSFFLLPLMIVILLGLFAGGYFYIKYSLVYETADPMHYLNNIKIGAASKRWQSAYELSKILANPDLVPQSDSFSNQMISMYEKSIHDDPKVRTYLALAMGITKDEKYLEVLLDGLNDNDIASRIAAIKSIGMIKNLESAKKIIKFLDSNYTDQEKLECIIALGELGDKSVIPNIKKMLTYEEPNIRWDAAIALAKLGDKSGKSIILNLLDREYYQNFKQVDYKEIEKAIYIAILTTKFFNDNAFVSKLKSLANYDSSILIKRLAREVLKEKNAI